MAVTTTYTDPSTSGAIDLATGQILTEVIYDKLLSNFKSIAGTTGRKAAPQGRLTLESGVPISTTDQTDKTTLYYTPYLGNSISLYTSSVWETLTFSELSLNISAYTASKPYDIWAYDNAGVVALDSTVFYINAIL